jgi:glycine oxidase
MSGAPKVTIAGAGALGLTTALALADAGAAVTVCDPADANASSVAAGMIAPLFEAVLDEQARPHLDLLLHARDHWPALADRAGLALDRSGAISVGADAWLDRVAGGFVSVGWRPSEIAGDTARALAPGLSDTFRRALLTREDWRVEPVSALAALRRAAQAAGVRIRRTAVEEAADDGVLVIATGAGRGLAAVAPELAGLSPIKGHIVRAAVPAVGVSVRGEGIYATPGDASLTIGATMEAGRDDTELDPAQVQALAAAGGELFPAVAQARRTAAAGVRAATPDGLPMVGWSGTAGVILAVGARRNGWLLAPLVAKMVAAYVMDRDPGPYAGRLAPGRFGEGR